MSLNLDKRTSNKDVLTQYGYAASVSAKGILKRDNGTFQRRLVQELKLNNITVIDEANKYLVEVFIPKFNTKVSLSYKKFKFGFEQSPSEEKINYTLAILTPRKIENGNSIKYYNQYYQPT